MMSPQEMLINQTPVRLGVLASGSGSNFEVISQAIERGEINAEIAQLVYNNPDAYVAERAARLGVAAECIDHRGFSDRESFDAAVVQALQAADVDWVIMAGWMRISTATLIDAFPDRILNLHPSLLPSFRGGRAVRDALSAGVAITGCTVHVVRLELDAGPIIAQSAVPVESGDTEQTLHQRIHLAEHELFPKAIAHAIALTET